MHIVSACHRTGELFLITVAKGRPSPTALEIKTVTRPRPGWSLTSLDPIRPMLEGSPHAAVAKPVQSFVRMSLEHPDCRRIALRC